MTFYIGQKSAGEIFLGSKKIGRLYLGQTLIHMTKVVSKPTFLEYIEFDGASYIDTGVVPVFGDKLEIYAALDNGATGNRALFSAGNGTYQFVLLPAGTSVTYYKYFETGSARYLAKSILGDIKLFECFADGSVSMDGRQVLEPKEDLTVQTVNTTMFIGCRANKTSYWLGKIGNAKLIASDGAVKFDLRPCIDPKGVVCFYDTVTKKYFYNQGTGELKAGEPLAEHEELEYLEFDGTHCIDTGLYQNSNMRVESTFVYEGHTEDGGFIPSRGMYGAKGSGSYIALYSDGYQKWGGVNSVYMDVSVFKDKKVNAVQDKNGVVVDGVLYEYTSVPEDFVNTTNTFLIGDTNGSSARPFIGKMYGLKLYENNVLIRDFIPVKRSDGVKCMYDKVENKYYELKGV